MELINVVLDCWADPPLEFSSGPLGGLSGSGSHASLGKGSAASQGGGRAKALRLASSAAATRDAAASPGVIRSGECGKEGGGGGGGASSLSFDPYCDGFLGPHTVSLLLSGVVDSWDRYIPVRGGLVGSCSAAAYGRKKPLSHRITSHLSHLSQAAPGCELCSDEDADPVAQPGDPGGPEAPAGVVQGAAMEPEAAGERRR